MIKFREFLAVCSILILTGNVFAADIILNEYNAVDGSLFLNGGLALFDVDGNRASDSYFGRVEGNGGDWFELVVITDHLDIRGWMLDIYHGGALDETLTLTYHSIWQDLRSGTIITVSEDVPNDISYDPAAGDWWINAQANNVANGLYIEASSFAVNSNDWQLRIRDFGGILRFGPAGEGISPASGVSDTEIFRLEAIPTASTPPSSADYDDGNHLSTFGSPNKWGYQDLYQLRSVAAAASTLTLLSPNGSEFIFGGTTHNITWSNTGTVESVLVEFSIDDGETWSGVYPPNAGNTGSYSWLVPIVDSYDCLVRVSNSADSAVNDASNAVFAIYECVFDGDLTGDCIIDMADLGVLAAFWLDCGNPYDPSCD